ncbi:MAG: hypothetical protein U5N86_06400 [Planctomycetota bacterium]|nr:hypothetical protein [Planctomycetota bacterium]
MSKKGPIFQDYIRSASLESGGIAVALAIGLLAGAIGNLMSIPSQVYSFNKALEDNGLYEFYYEDYTQKDRYSDPDVLTRVEKQKVDKLTEILSEKAPGIPVTMLMFVLGLGIMLVFFFRLFGAFYKRINALQMKLEELVSPTAQASLAESAEAEDDEDDSEAEDSEGEAT